MGKGAAAREQGTHTSAPGPAPSVAPKGRTPRECPHPSSPSPLPLSRCPPEDSWGGPQTHLFQLDLRVDLDIADLTVEGSVLGRGLGLPGSGRPQPGVGFDGAQATAGLQNGLVLRTWSPQGARGGEKFSRPARPQTPSFPMTILTGCTRCGALPSPLRPFQRWVRGGS